MLRTGTGDRELTVGAYLADWLEVQRHRLQPTTLKSYTGNVDRYLAPNIGDVALIALDIRQLERLYAELMSRGGKGGRPLSRRTVEYPPRRCAQPSTMPCGPDCSTATPRASPGCRRSS